MRHIDDAQVDELIGPREAQQALLAAFRSFGEGRASMQERIRTESGAVKLSTLGAVMPDQGFVGAKVYTTIAGQFHFVILLFDAADGRPLASLDAGAITRLRTAATSVIASRYLARPGARSMALFGAGVQGREHARQMADAYELSEIRVCDPFAAPTVFGDLERECGVAVRPCTANDALAAPTSSSPRRAPGLRSSTATGCPRARSSPRSAPVFPTRASSTIERSNVPRSWPSIGRSRR